MFSLEQDTAEEILCHAKEEFPYECCGAILSDDSLEYVRRCTNIQNERHRMDPEAYPRDARTAYLVDPDDLINLHKEAHLKHRSIKAFYHSHPNEDAYFSEKDKSDATQPWSTPNYPDTTYIVISVCDLSIKEVRAYAWDDGTEEFSEISINLNA